MLIHNLNINMMKNKKPSKIYALLCILLFTASAYGQKLTDKVSIPFDSTTEKFTYVEIFEVPDKSSSELYQTVKSWFKEKYLQQDLLIDSENEEITDKGNFTVRTVLKIHKTKSPITRTVVFNLNFLFKNGKAKLEISN